jgi:hypothetical protein
MVAGTNTQVKNQKSCLTQPALEVWDSAVFSSIFLASSFSSSQTESTPAHTISDLLKLQINQFIGKMGKYETTFGSRNRKGESVMRLQLIKE